VGVVRKLDDTSAAHGTDVAGDGSGLLADDRLDQLVRLRQADEESTLVRMGYGRYRGNRSTDESVTRGR
jgi:hypothetical protein